MPGQLRAATNWRGPVGTGGLLANALRSWSVLRFEVTEDPSVGVDGQRFCHTPQLGLWGGAMSANGDVMVGEMRLRMLMAAGADTLAAELDSVLGTAWDESLEPYRNGGDGARRQLAQPGRGLARQVRQASAPAARRGTALTLRGQQTGEFAVGVHVDTRALHRDRRGAPRASRCRGRRACP